MKTIIISLLCMTLFSSVSFSQDGRLTPSYDENSQYIRDHPEVDINVEKYISSWKLSPVTTGHGGFSEQTILTRGNPVEPPSPGALLKYLYSYSHGLLSIGSSTTPFKEAKKQTVFYVMGGNGTIESSGKMTPFGEGYGIFVPAGVEYSFSNKSSKPVEVLIITEEVPDGFTPRHETLIRNFRDVTPDHCCWGYTIYSLFGKKDGLFEPMGIAIVTINGLGMGSPHYHVAGCEEIWTKVKGNPNLLMLGKKLLRQDIGEAFIAPPNGLVPHSVINPGDSEMAWLYIGNRHDK